MDLESTTLSQELDDSRESGRPIWNEIISIDQIAFHYKNLGWWESVVPNNPTGQIWNPNSMQDFFGFTMMTRNEIFHKDINENAFAADRIVPRIAMGITRAILRIMMSDLLWYQVKMWISSVKENPA